MSVELRPYQIPPTDWLVEKGGGFVRVDTGGGKTYIAQVAARRVGYNRLLIVAPSSALYTWVEHFHEYEPDVQVRVLDGSVSRKNRIERYKTAREQSSEQPQAIIVTVGQIRSEPKEVASFAADICIWDEAHRLYNKPKQKNKSKLFNAACVALKRARLIMLSGNRRGQGPHEWWSILHLLDRKRFPSFWKFVNRYMYVDEGPYGRDIIGVRKDAIDDFRAMLKRYVFNVPSEELQGYVPERNRQRLTIPMPAKLRGISKRLYDELCADLGEIPGFESDEIILAANQLDRATQLRQLHTCPALIVPELGPGPAIQAIVDHAASTNENKIVIFTDFVEAFEWFERFLREKGFSEVYKISGAHTKPEIIPVVARQFDAFDEGKKSALLASIGMAESYNIRNAKTAYLTGFSWDEDRNYQAEGRLMRGDKAFVNIFYVIQHGSIEVNVLERMTHKRQFTSAVL